MNAKRRLHLANKKTPNTSVNVIFFAIVNYSLLIRPTVMLFYLLLSFFYQVARAPSRAEACLTGWPNAQPQGGTSVV